MAMSDIQSKIDAMEKELSGAKYNKATEHHFAIVKAQIAKLREKMEKRAASKGGGSGWFIKKSGDASVVLLGYPSVGKSTLLNKMTGAKSKVAAYEFTTLDVIPGVFEYHNAKIQILDVPGIIQGAAEGRGRGKEVLAMVRAADLILVLIDALHPEHYEVLLKELYQTGVRANQRAPDVKIKMKMRGGIDIGTTVKLSKVSKDSLMAILREFHIGNADVLIRTDVDIDQFIDALEGNRVYIPVVPVITKADLLPANELKRLVERIKPAAVVAAEKGEGIADLKEAIFRGLRFVRVFLKEANKKPDMDEPLVLRAGASIRTVCARLHRDFVKKFRFAKIWGKTSKFPGQVFRDLDKPLTDGDIIELHIA